MTRLFSSRWRDEQRWRDCSAQGGEMNKNESLTPAQPPTDGVPHTTTPTQPPPDGVPAQTTPPQPPSDEVPSTSLVACTSPPPRRSCSTHKKGNLPNITG